VLPGKSVADLEQAIYAEIEKVKNAPIAAWEITKSQNSWKRSYVAALSSSLQKAVQLGDYALRANDPNLINTYADRIAKVTAADVQRVAKQYLTVTNRTVVITNPKAASPAGAASKGGAR
jgi:predicted Zn-dependent peptidase